MNVPKHIFIGGIVLLSLLPFLWPLTRVVERPIDATTWALVAVSTVLNVVTIFYHVTMPPHPKFLIIWWRRLILRIHITGGSVEFIAGMAALAGAGPAAGTIMALAALVLHVPSALAQAHIVFGSRAVMRPAYLAAIGIHAFCASMLLVHPGSTYWVVCTFLVFNIYVWCRIYYYLFERYALFPDSKYSVSILAAGLTTLPAFLGATAMLTIVTSIAVYMALYTAFFVRGRMEFLEFVRERARDNAFEPGAPDAWNRIPEAGDAAAARRLFDEFDTDADGGLSGEDLVRGLSTTAIPPELMRRLVPGSNGDRLDFAGFQRHCWSLREVREHARDREGMRAARSERDKAELVFRRLDTDGDGVLGPTELDALLTKWAMPHAEASRWLARIRGPDPRGIDFERFFTRMRPVWRFIYYEIMEATTGRKHDMIARALAARRSDVKTKEVRRDVRRELVSRLPFLQGAPEAFLDELAESLVEEKYAAGWQLIEEGAPGDTCWIVRSGGLRVTRGGELLGELGPGAWLGEGALLTDQPRSASAVVTADAQLYAITRPSFQYLVTRYPEMMANLKQIHEERRLQTMRRAVQVDLLGKVEFLAEATPALLDDLARALTLRVIDGVVLREGDPAAQFFMVGRGSVQVMHGPDVVAELAQGAYFGEAALLSGTRQPATVVTVGRAALYVLARDDFERVLRNHPGVLQQIRDVHLRRTNERVRRVLHERLVRQVPFLRQAEPAFLEALARDLRPQTVPDGYPVFEQGEEGDRMYFIARGGMRISRGAATVAELREGAYFGEMALLTAQPRTASAKAMGTTELLELDRAGFEQLVSAHPAVHAHLDQVRQERARQLQALEQSRDR